MAWRQQSKFRNIRPVPYQQIYPDLRVSEASGDPTIACASVMWFAYLAHSSTGGTVGVLGHHEHGKRTKNVPLIHAHSAQINDMSFDPFHDWTLATASSDCTVKIWKLPEDGLTGDTSDALLALNAGSRVDCLGWNPTAENILATGGTDDLVKVWDLQAEKAAITLDQCKSNIQFLDWNRNGSQLAVTSKDKKVRVFDPRGNQVAQEGDGHPGTKPQKVRFVENAGKIITTGDGRSRDREFSVWDLRNLKSALSTTRMGPGTATLVPYYDYDSKILVLSSRGDSSVRLYEMKDNSPHFTEIQGYRTDKPHRGITVLPKRALSVMSCEIIRVIRVMNDHAQPIKFQVPRKSYADFHEDLFPPALSSKPALSNSDWLGGKTADPNVVSLAPERPAEETQGSSPSQPKPKKKQSTNIWDKKEAKPLTKTVTLSANASEEERKAAGNEDDDTEWYEPKKLNIVRASKYRHIFGKPWQRTQCYDNLRVLNQAIQAHSIRMNQKFFAYPWDGTAGQLGVMNLKETGRLPSTHIPTLETGSEIYDFDLSRHTPDLIAVGLENAHLKVMKVPSDLLKRKENFRDTVADLTGHYNRIITVDFHPLASNVILTGSGDLTMKLWDLNKQEEKLTLKGFEDLPLSPAWNYNGTVLATACKDNKVRLFDPRKQSVVQELPNIGGAKGVNIAWMGEEQRILVTDFARSSAREVSIYDLKNPGKPFATSNIDSGQTLQVPEYDPDTGVLMLWAKGDGVLRFCEINDKAPYIHPLTDYKTSVPQIGIACFHRTEMDVKGVELFRVLKLTKSSVAPISFKVPRQRKEFFQDDIYTPTRAVEATYTSDEWFGGATKKPKMKDLRPDGMKPLSKAPKIIRKVRKFNPETDTQMDASQFTDMVLDKFHSKMQDYKEGEEEPLPGADLSGVDSDEWSD